MDYYERSLILHEQLRGKLSVVNKLPVFTRDDLSLAYTPGVARPCEVIAADPSKARLLTIKHNSVAIVSDGSAVLGLGNIGALASIPVMEGKALLFKQYANINAWPICLDTQDTEEIIRAVRYIAPVFGGINLEDISAPRCFEIERRLQDLGIPVFHDDQHGTAIVLLAAMINASRVLSKPLERMDVVINGAGAAGTAIAELLNNFGLDEGEHRRVKSIVVCDTKGAISKDRKDLSQEKLAFLETTNFVNRTGPLLEVLRDADVFIGVSVGGLLRAEDIKRMAPNPVVMAMANPEPEIMPDEARKGGAAIIGTGRSDFPNQVNNMLAFPGIFRGALDSSAERITRPMKIAAAYALADAVSPCSAERILPDPLDPSIPGIVARAVAKAARSR